MSSSRDELIDTRARRLSGRRVVLSPDSIGAYWYWIDPRYTLREVNNPRNSQAPDEARFRAQGVTKNASGQFKAKSD